MRRSAAVGLLSVALAGCCFGLPGGASPRRRSPAPLPAPAPAVAPAAPPAAPSVGACGIGYTMRAGQAVSPTDPMLRDYVHPGQTLPLGYIAIELKRADRSSFPDCRVRFSLYRYRGGVRAIEMENERDLHHTDGIYNKSWRMHEPGDWEIVVSDAVSNLPLASVRFVVVAA